MQIDAMIRKSVAELVGTYAFFLERIWAGKYGFLPKSAATSGGQ